MADGASKTDRGETLTWRIEGMDCASCVGEIERALDGMPGISDVYVNMMTERLTLRFDPDRTPPESIERRLASVGHKAVRLPPAANASVAHAARERASEEQARGSAQLHAHGVHHEDEAAEGKAWWQTAKGRLVIGLGALVGGAWLLSELVGERYGHWIYVAATIVALWPFGRRALALARAGSPFSIEMLMVVAAAGALVIGAAAEAALVVFLFAVGELLENVAAGRARAGIRALVALIPRTARRESADGSIKEVPAERLAVEDIVQVRPGDRVPCDGTILEGHSALDESPVTGESVPVPRGPGEPVLAGSITTDGALRVRVTRAAADNTIARIVRLVEEATASRAPTQRFIERFAGWWTPSAMAISAVVILAPPLLFGGDWWTWTYRGLALLLVACPCALVISVPAAVASGLSSGARHGLLVKGGAALEAIGKATTVAFDKTGTLTAGRPRVTDVVPLAAGVDEAEALRLAAAVEQGSSHPLARAVLEAASDRSLAVPVARASVTTPGKAVAATAEGRRVVLASPGHVAEAAGAAGGGNAWLGEEAEARIEALQSDGKTVSVLLADQAPLALLAFRDEPRSDAAAGVAALRSLGAGTVMLTGDNARTGAAIGRALGLDVQAGLLPDDKLRVIEAMKVGGPVVMVGDGINDAPALAAASVGVAMGGGTDVALETADAALLKERVTGVAELVALSRTTLANIRQNVAIALGLKAVFLVTTMAGITGLWPAILADTGATVLVTLNALRLLRWRPRFAHQEATR